MSEQEFTVGQTTTMNDMPFQAEFGAEVVIKRVQVETCVVAPVSDDTKRFTVSKLALGDQPEEQE